MLKFKIGTLYNFKTDLVPAFHIAQSAYIAVRDDGIVRAIAVHEYINPYSVHAHETMGQREIWAGQLDDVITRTLQLLAFNGSFPLFVIPSRLEKQKGGSKWEYQGIFKVGQKITDPDRLAQATKHRLAHGGTNPISMIVTLVPDSLFAGVTITATPDSRFQKA